MSHLLAAPAPALSLAANCRLHISSIRSCRSSSSTLPLSRRSIAVKGSGKLRYAPALQRLRTAAGERFSHHEMHGHVTIGCSMQKSHQYPCTATSADVERGSICKQMYKQICKTQQADTWKLTCCHHHIQLQLEHWFQTHMHPCSNKTAFLRAAVGCGSHWSSQPVKQRIRAVYKTVRYAVSHLRAALTPVSRSILTASAA